jgi:hypothetical protein
MVGLWRIIHILEYLDGRANKISRRNMVEHKGQTKDDPTVWGTEQLQRVN